MTRNRLYSLLGILCLAGYSWFFFAHVFLSADDRLTVCYFKNISGIPCPSCGSTRAVSLLASGDFKASVLMNPIGLLLAVIMIVLPVWLAYDLLLKKQTLFSAYVRTEEKIRIRWVAAVLILLVVANWIWNIEKGL